MSISKISILGLTIENQGNAQIHRSLAGAQHGATTDENNDDNIRHEFAEDREGLHWGLNVKCP